jgi:hypothetical protein
MSRKFYIDPVSDGNIYPLKKWIRNNFNLIDGFVFSATDITHRIVAKLEALAWIQYTPDSETVIMIKSGKRQIKQAFKEKTKQKSSNIPGDLSRRLKGQFNSRLKAGRNAFKTFEEYCEWYLAQPKVCYYCGVSEETVRKIVMTGKLKSARFPLNAVVTQGRSRGVNLEVDRWDSSKPYSKGNCRLACYFCNNDKSDVFDGKQYLQFFQNRKMYLDKLAKIKRK